MNCPHHCEIYNFKPHSYKELPIRIAEFEPYIGMNKVVNYTE